MVQCFCSVCCMACTINSERKIDMSNEIRITVEEVPVGTLEAQQGGLKLRFPKYQDWIGELALGQPWSDGLRTNVLNATKDYYPDTDTPIGLILEKLDVAHAATSAVVDTLVSYSTRQRRDQILDGFTIDETVDVRLARTDIVHYEVGINDEDKERIANEARRLRDEDGLTGDALINELRRYVIDMIHDDPGEYEYGSLDTDYGDEDQVNSDTEDTEVNCDRNEAHRSLRTILENAGVNIDQVPENDEDDDEDGDDDDGDDDESSDVTPATPAPPATPEIRIISYE